MEFQRLLAPVMTARWMVMHRTGGEPFVINEIGLVGTSDPSTGDVGWALPLSRSSPLCIYPKVSRAVAHHQYGWWAVIEHRLLPVSDGGGTNGFNDLAAKAAAEFVAAAEVGVAERLRPLVASPPAPGALMEMWPFDSWMLRHHEHEWFRLVGATHSDPLPEQVGDLQELTFDGLNEGWAPMVILGVTFPRCQLD